MKKKINETKQTYQQKKNVNKKNHIKKQKNQINKPYEKKKKKKKNALKKIYWKYFKIFRFQRIFN